MGLARWAFVESQPRSETRKLNPCLVITKQERRRKDMPKPPSSHGRSADRQRKAITSPPTQWWGNKEKGSVPYEKMQIYITGSTVTASIKVRGDGRNEIEQCMRHTAMGRELKTGRGAKEKSFSNLRFGAPGGSAHVELTKGKGKDNCNQQDYHYKEEGKESPGVTSSRKGCVRRSSWGEFNLAQMEYSKGHSTTDKKHKKPLTSNGRLF